jgi:hypothetical protein
MKPRITLKKIWFDDDITELKIEVCDGNSIFSNKVYVGHTQIESIVKDLNVFREQIYGGLHDIKLGEFGPEYANGGFQARLNFHVPGKLYISSFQQSDFEEFSRTLVASEAKMYLKTEPVLLDKFIIELNTLISGASDEATLICCV